jgi:hypothetical protein
VLYREKSAVCSEIYKNHRNTLCEQNVELMNVNSGGKQSNHCVLKGLFFHAI